MRITDRVALACIPLIVIASQMKCFLVFIPLFSFNFGETRNGVINKRVIEKKKLYFSTYRKHLAERKFLNIWENDYYFRLFNCIVLLWTKRWHDELTLILEDQAIFSQDFHPRALTKPLTNYGTRQLYLYPRQGPSLDRFTISRVSWTQVFLWDWNGIHLGEGEKFMDTGSNNCNKRERN